MVAGVPMCNDCFTHALLPTNTNIQLRITQKRNMHVAQSACVGTATAVYRRSRLQLPSFNGKHRRGPSWGRQCRAKYDASARPRCEHGSSAVAAQCATPRQSEWAS